MRKTLTLLIYHQACKCQCSYLRMVQREGAGQTLAKGFAVSGEATADGTSQVTVAVQITWKMRKKNCMFKWLLFGNTKSHNAIITKRDGLQVNGMKEMRQQCPLEAEHVPAQDLVAAAHGSQPFAVLNAVPSGYDVTRLHRDGSLTWKQDLLLQTQEVDFLSEYYYDKTSHRSPLWFEASPAWRSQIEAGGPALHLPSHYTTCRTKRHRRKVPCCGWEQI